jgi:hypothetical protein
MIKILGWKSRKDTVGRYQEAAYLPSKLRGRPIVRRNEHQMKDACSVSRFRGSVAASRSVKMDQLKCKLGKPPGYSRNSDREVAG